MKFKKGLKSRDSSSERSSTTALPTGVPGQLASARAADGDSSGAADADAEVADASAGSLPNQSIIISGESGAGKTEVSVCPVHMV